MTLLILSTSPTRTGVEADFSFPAKSLMVNCPAMPLPQTCACAGCMAFEKASSETTTSAGDFMKEHIPIFIRQFRYLYEFSLLNGSTLRQASLRTSPIRKHHGVNQKRSANLR